MAERIDSNEFSFEVTLSESPPRASASDAHASLTSMDHEEQQAHEWEDMTEEEVDEPRQARSKRTQAAKRTGSSSRGGRANAAAGGAARGGGARGRGRKAADDDDEEEYLPGSSKKGAAASSKKGAAAAKKSAPARSRAKRATPPEAAFSPSPPPAAPHSSTRKRKAVTSLRKEAEEEMDGAMEDDGGEEGEVADEEGDGPSAWQLDGVGEEEEEERGGPIMMAATPEDEDDEDETVKAIMAQQAVQMREVLQKEKQKRRNQREDMIKNQQAILERLAYIFTTKRVLKHGQDVVDELHAQLRSIIKPMLAMNDKANEVFEATMEAWEDKQQTFEAGLADILKAANADTGGKRSDAAEYQKQIKAKLSHVWDVIKTQNELVWKTATTKRRKVIVEI